MNCLKFNLLGFIAFLYVGGFAYGNNSCHSLLKTTSIVEGLPLVKPLTELQIQSAPGMFPGNHIINLYDHIKGSNIQIGVIFKHIEDETIANEVLNNGSTLHTPFKEGNYNSADRYTVRGIIIKSEGELAFSIIVLQQKNRSGYQSDGNVIYLR